MIYRRVSTDMQREEGFSLQAQKLRLEAYAQSQGWTIIEDYSDEGFSAKNIERPALQSMISDMKQKKFDIILVYRLDRFVRSVLDLHELLILMEQYDVKFKSATEVFDTTSATGRMFITIIATLAQWERETIAERVFESMLKRSEQGKRNGAPPPYGYDIINGNLIPNIDEAKWVRYIFHRYPINGSQNIAKQLNKKGVKTKKNEVWSDFSIRYILRNPIYAGFVRWNHRTITGGKSKYTGNEVITKVDQDNFEPLVDQETFAEAQKIMKERSNIAFRSDNHYPFSGVAKCANCGKPFTGAFKKRRKGGVYRFYKCAGRFKFGICDIQTIAEEAIEKALLDSLVIDNNDSSIPEVELFQEEYIDEEEIHKRTQQLQIKKERAEELYIEGNISKQRYQKIIEVVKDEELELTEIIQRKEEEVSQEEIETFLLNLLDEWSQLDYASQKHAIRSIFESFTIELVEPTKHGATPTLPVVKIIDYQFKV
ncbi:recombinase family protein [Bacillus solimangrovi]|uniref:recombinase family protein n=1 Tax=Bacillus solimangrovi TaxID=1305675 RepID=UPI000AC1379F|nr:recombinase family protein [Bacillus solimangrovi]